MAKRGSSVRPEHLEEISYLRNSGLIWSDIEKRLPYTRMTMVRALERSRPDSLNAKINLHVPEWMKVGICEKGGEAWVRNLIAENLVGL